MSITKFWPTPAQVNACIQPEAEIPPAAVLLAVHRPMEFQFVEGQDHRPVREGYLLERLLDPNVERGTALLTIRGSSGVGKSHAIRWLEAKLRAMPDSESRHIILLPKSTSLKGAIKLILAGLEGSRFDPLKKRLKTSRDHVDLGEAAVRLRTNLEIEINRRIDQAAAAVSSARARGETASEKDRQWQTHKALRDVILHPGLRDRWVGIGDSGEPKGVLAEVAARVLKEGRILDENTRLQFKADDLTFEPEELQDVAGETRRYLQTLGMAGGKHRKDAIDLLNSVIDDAANQLLDLGDTGLKDLFDDIRQELLRQGKELIVLIEDFAVLSGMQGALLDALIKEAIEKGNQVRCTMRTALAVTTGYQLPTTVLTRSTGDFLIEDMPFQDNESALDAMVQLVGRYLNAARIDRPALETAYARHGDEAQSWVPRFEDSIELEDSDRATLDAFGVSQAPDGFFLFPFNRAALRQLATLRLSKTEHGEARFEFKPRNILKLVVRKTLIENGPDFQDGKFPPASYNEADTVNRTPTLAEEFRKLEPDPAKRGRLAALVRFWGDNPTSPRRTDWKLPARIALAFGLHDIGTIYVEPKPPDSPKPPVGAGQSEVSPKPPIKDPKPEKPVPLTPFDTWRATIDDWLTGRLKTLPQDESRQLRQWVAADVLSAISWDLEILPFPVEQCQRRFRDMVFLERAAGKGNTSEEDCSILAVSREDLSTTASADAVGLALQALVRCKLEGSWAFDTDGESYTRWANFILPKRARAVTFLKKEYSSDLLSPAARALYLGTRILNVPGAHSDSPEEYANALFAEVSVTSAPAPAARSANWSVLKSAAAQNRKCLQQFVLRFIGARTSGAGNPHALNFSALLAALGDVQTTLVVSGDQIGTTDEAELKPALEHAKQLRNQLRTALTKQADDFRQRIQHCSQELGASLNKELIKKEMAELVSKCSVVLSMPYDSCEALREAAQAFAASSYQRVEIVSASAPQSSLLAFVGSVDEQSLAIAETFLEEFRKFTTAVESKLRLGAISGGVGQLKSEQVQFQKEVADTAALATISLPDLAPSAAKEETAAPEAKRKSEKTPAPTNPAATCQLLLKCQQLAQDLADYTDREKFKLKAASLRDHRQKFQSAREELQDAMKPWKLLESHKVPGLAKPSPPAAVRTGLPEIFSRITDKPEQMNAGRVMTDCLDELDSFATAYRDRAIAAWGKYKESSLYVGVSLPLVQTFKQIPTFALKAAELERAIVTHDDNLQTIPESDQKWKDCEASYNLCQQRVKKLPLADLHKDVRSFLEQTVAGGAALSSLTQVVQDWIKEHSLEMSFVIRSANSSSQSGRLF